MTVGLGISPVLFDEAVTVNVCVSPPPGLMPVRFTVCSGASSRIAAGSGIALSVGGSFTGVTFTVKVRENVLVPPPSSITVTVTIADPFASATGV